MLLHTWLRRGISDLQVADGSNILKLIQIYMLLIYRFCLFGLIGWSEMFDCAPGIDGAAWCMLPDIAVTQKHKVLIAVDQ